MKKLLAALVLAAAAACADRTATQYVGTVMNEASPEAEGTLKLTLFTRDDTSFSGVIDLGPRSTGTGTAYVWHEGSELRMVSVGATSGDTILWTSKLTDEGLGGRYEVTGGARKGEGGTWRARLAKGPPATPATLRQPQGIEPPPISATWTLVVLLGVLWGVARWIRRAPQPSDDDAAVVGVGSVSGAVRPELSGVAGWLLLFLIGQSIGILVGLARLRTLGDEWIGGLGVGAAVTGMQPLVLLEVAIQLLAIPAALAGIILLVRRSRYAPRYWYSYLTFTAAYLFLDLVLAAIINSQLKRFVGPDEWATLGTDDGGAKVTTRQLGMALVWAQYWVRSKRVRATFGAGARDRTAHVPQVASVRAEPAMMSPSPWRRRTRLAAQTVGALVGLIVVLSVVMARVTRVTPYSLGPGTDIRKSVAGRWAWTTSEERCADPHTIAFSDDGKVMTIVRPTDDLGATDSLTTTTYDIEFVTQSTIRGAIRGEDRLTADGKPVVWDLVLVGPDEYRWRRTDWSTRSYTAGIVRCPANDVADTPTR